MRREAVFWIREAWADLCSAKVLYGARRWNASAFYGHQAVEKALKSLYFVALRREPPNTHVLTELYREIKRAGIEFSPGLEERIAELNKFYSVSRYPDAAAGQPYEVVTKGDADRSLKTAEEVLELVENLLRAVGYEGTPSRILEIVNKFIRGIEETGIRVVEAYLFGSYARGDWIEESDVDLIIVSPDFGGMRWLDRLDLAAKVWLRLGLEKWVEVLPYTPEEFKRAREESAVVKDAERYWIKVR